MEVRETDASRVFLAGRLAYKVRKPVRFPFLDYRSLQRRRSLVLEYAVEMLRLPESARPRLFWESAVAHP